MNKIIRKAIVLALAGSALLYSGCTKDYAEDITELQKELSELKTYATDHINGLEAQVSVLKNTVSSLEETRDKALKRISDLETLTESLQTQLNDANGEINGIKGQIAGINSEITALQNAVDAINQAINAANNRISALETSLAKDYYKKSDVDSKIQALRDYADQTFATKEAVAEINTALGQLAGVVDAIKDVTIPAIQAELATASENAQKALDEIELLKTALAGVKSTAEEALTKANKALGDIATLEENLRLNYYTKTEIETKLQTLKDAIDLEIEELKKADKAQNERIDSLAAVTKAIEDDIVEFKSQTAAAFLILGLALEQEITARQADSVMFAQGIAANKASIEALGRLVAELKDTTVQIRTQLNEALAKIAANTQAIEDEVKAREELDKKVELYKKNLQDQIDSLAQVTTDLRTYIDSEIEKVNKRIDALSDAFNAAKERVQSIVFVPEYTDLLATANYIVYGGDTLRTVVKATYEVKPVTALDYVLENVDSLLLAARELASRADVDDVFSDIVLVGSDAEKGRFTIEAYVPEILHEGKTAVSLVFGNYEVGSYGLSGNSIQSSYVGMFFDPEKKIDLSGRYTWYDITENAAVQEDTIKDIDNVAYTAPIKKEKPRVCFADYKVYMEDGGQYFTPETLEKKYHLDPGTLSTFNYDVVWTVFGVNGDRVDDKTPFNFEKDVPATEFFTDYIVSNDNDTIINKIYVGDTTRHIQTLCRGNEVLRLVAFAQFDITKNIIPGYVTPQCDTIPWSYVYYNNHQDGFSYVENKSFDVIDDILNSTQLSVANEFTHNGDAFVPQGGETMVIASEKITYNNWLFEADTVKYVSKGWKFETETDIYPGVEIPFVVLPTPKDRTTKIDLGTLPCTPTNGLEETVFAAIEKAFNGEEAYFIGDATGDDATIPALYTAFVGSMPFEITGYSVDNGDLVTIDPQDEEWPIEIVLNYNADNGDCSTISVAPGTFSYDQTVLVKGYVEAFGVTFSFEITFKTPENPFKLVLTPYGSFDPAKSKTIIVEGDDQFDKDGNPTDDPDAKRYNIQQMYYTKYLQVQDKEGNVTNNGEDLEVRFEFVYEDYAEFGIEFDEEATAADTAEADAMRGVFGGITDVVEANDGDNGGLLDQGAILTWGTYQGRDVKVYAALYDSGFQVSEKLAFGIWTAKPVEFYPTGIDEFVIGAEEPIIRTAGEPIDIRPASVLVVGGILSRDANNDYKPYYVSDPSVYGYNDNNIVMEGFYTGHRPNRDYHPAGEFHPFYGPLSNEGDGRRIERNTVIFGFDNITAVINETPWPLTYGGDYAVTADDYGEIFTLIKDSGKGDIEITIPFKFRYYLDYCGAKPQEGKVIVKIKQI